MSSTCCITPPVAGPYGSDLVCELVYIPTLAIDCSYEGTGPECDSGTCHWVFDSCQGTGTEWYAFYKYDSDTCSDY